MKFTENKVAIVTAIVGATVIGFLVYTMIKLRRVSNQLNDVVQEQIQTSMEVDQISKRLYHFRPPSGQTQPPPPQQHVPDRFLADTRPPPPAPPPSEEAKHEEEEDLDKDLEEELAELEKQKTGEEI